MNQQSVAFWSLALPTLRGRGRRRVRDRRYERGAILAPLAQKNPVLPRLGEANRNRRDAGSPSGGALPLRAPHDGWGSRSSFRKVLRQNVAPRTAPDRAGR